MWPQGRDVPGKQFLPPSAASPAFPETKLVERVFQADTGGELYSPHELLSWERFKPVEMSKDSVGFAHVLPSSRFPLVSWSVPVCTQGRAHLHTVSTCASTLTSPCRCTHSLGTWARHPDPWPAVRVRLLSSCPLSHRPHSGVLQVPVTAFMKLTPSLPGGPGASRNRAALGGRDPSAC